MTTHQELTTSDLITTTAPHFVDPKSTTRRMMLDVLIGLTPVLVAALWHFGTAAAMQVAVCLAAAWVTEAAILRLRRQPVRLQDGSVSITALILAFSLPPQLPVYASTIGTVVAVALGKMAYGGLGYNLFNPAMVGRAFLMVCFPAVMTTWHAPQTVDAVAGATSLAAAKFSQEYAELVPLLRGDVAGSLGETSAVLVLVGGLWVLFRGAGDWRLTVGMLAGVAGVALVEQLVRGNENCLGVLRHLCAGAVMLGAFFIVTDPVTSPLSKSGRWMFGIGVGVLTMIIRLFAGYPEGVMFAVLLGNAATPMLNRWTLPTPVGGPVPKN